MRGNAKAATSRLPGWSARAGALVAMGLTLQLVGCSREFVSCEESKTCAAPPDGSSSSSGGASGGVSGSSGGASQAGGLGGAGLVGSGSGGVDAGARSTGGGSGRADGGATPDGGSTDGAAADGAPFDAHVTPPCSTVDGGIQSDPDHCGACDTVCKMDGTVARACVAGVCKPTCDDTHRDCNGDGKDGCEIDVDGDPLHCSACDVSCAVAGTASQACALGVCKPTCDGAHTDCNGDGKDGCEVDLRGDPNHCGACDVVCATTGTTAQACIAGVCKPTCDGAHTDCNGDGKDGCEVTLKTDVKNCGACGYACSSAQTSQLRCVAGACSPVCLSGHGDCSKSAPAPDNGCETNLNVATDCGACGHDCLGGQCASLTCQEVSIATSLPNPRSVTVTASNVYWTDGSTTDGRVMRASLFGTGATPVATAQGSPWDIENDGQFVYWTNAYVSASAIRRVNIDGTPIIQDVVTSSTSTAVYSPGRFALDAQYLYWCDTYSSYGFRISKDGSDAPLKILPSPSGSCRDVKVDSASVYYASGGWMLVPLDGSAPPRGITSSSVNTHALALDASALFYRAEDPVTQLPAFWRIPKESSNPADATMVAAVNPNDYAFAVDAKYIYYWSDAIYRVPKTGGTPVKLSGNVNSVNKMIVHDEQGGEALYWVNYGSSGTNGSVVKIAL